MPKFISLLSTVQEKIAQAKKDCERMEKAGKALRNLIKKANCKWLNVGQVSLRVGSYYLVRRQPNAMMSDFKEAVAEWTGDGWIYHVGSVTDGGMFTQGFIQVWTPTPSPLPKVKTTKRVQPAKKQKK